MQRRFAALAAVGRRRICDWSAGANGLGSVALVLSGDGWSNHSNSMPLIHPVVCSRTGWRRTPTAAPIPASHAVLSAIAVMAQLWGLSWIVTELVLGCHCQLALPALALPAFVPAFVDVLTPFPPGGAGTCTRCSGSWLTRPQTERPPRLGSCSCRQHSTRHSRWWSRCRARPHWHLRGNNEDLQHPARPIGPIQSNGSGSKVFERCPAQTVHMHHMYHIKCITSNVSHHNVSHHMYHITMYRITCITSHVSHHMYHITCITSYVSHHMYHITCIISHVSYHMYHERSAPRSLDT